MITTNIAKIIEGLSDFEKKQLPYIQMLTANNIAFDALEAMKKNIRQQLQIRKKSVVNSFRIKKATKSKPYAELYVDEFRWQYKVLAHHFNGGTRESKGMEKALIYWGYMYKWEILTPSPGVNIKPSTYVQMMSQLRLDYKAGYNSNETKRSKLRKTASRKSKVRYFLITGKSNSPLAPGVYARMPLHDKPICILRISEKPNYRQRLNLQRTVMDVYNNNAEKHFNNAYIRAIMTAR